MKFYLAGIIGEAVGNDYILWREDMAKFLESHGHSALDPCKQYDAGVGDARDFLNVLSEKKQLKDIRLFMQTMIMPKDKKMVLESDGIIAYIREYTCGTLREVTLADENGIPVYVICPKQRVNNTLIGMSTRIFSSITGFKYWFKTIFNSVLAETTKQ